MVWSLGVMTASIVYAAAGPLGIDPDLVEPYDGYYLGEVVPTPQTVHYSEDFVLLVDPLGGATVPVIVPANAPVQVRLAAAELSARAGLLVGAASNEQPFLLPVVEAGSADAHAAQQDTSVIFEMAGPQEPKASWLRPEGYQVSMTLHKGGVRVRVLAVDAVGAYYASQSLQQLMTVHDGRVVLRRAEISDWPAFTLRAHQYDGGFPAPDQARYSLRWAAKLKLNQLGFGQAYDMPMQWKSLTDEQKTSTTYLCGRARAVGVIRAAFYLHPHRSKPEFNISISDSADMDALAAICASALEAGARAIMLRSDDIWPLAPEDQARFGDQASAHIFMVNELNRRLREQWPDLIFMFCPPHYTNGTIQGRKGAEDYTRRIGHELAKDVLIVWTGPVTRSLEIKPDDVDYFVGLCGRKPLLWDNTVYAHRSRYGYDPRNPSYFLDTFATKYPDNFSERSAGVSFNWSVSSPLALVGGINTADCVWNPRAYDPEASLRRALAMVAGPENVENILGLRNAYYQIFDAVTSGAALQHAEEVVTATDKIEELLGQLRENCHNESFVRAVEGAARRMEERAATLRSLSETLNRARKKALVELNFTAGEWQRQTEGEWTVAVQGKTAIVEFPWGTKSATGARGTLLRRVTLPESPTGRYYLVFSCSDDYTHAGTPPHAWPGYLLKQALIDGQVVWEDDVEGDEPMQAQAVCVVDVTAHLQGKKEATVAFQGLERRGVSNMGVKITFGSPALVPGPFDLTSQRGEVPGSTALSPTEALTIFVEFDLGAVGSRQALFDKAPPHQYFGFVHEDGSIVAGIFSNGKEQSVKGTTPLAPGLHWAAFVYDGQKMLLVVDGREDSGREFAGRIDAAAGNFHLGQYSGGSLPLEGRIRAAAAWGRALSTSDLQDAAGGRPPVAGLSGAWRLDEEGIWQAPNRVEGGETCTVYREYAPHKGQ